MRHVVSASCEFATSRLRVGPWHSVRSRIDGGLDEAVAGLLTERSTEGLPTGWQGDYSLDRARAWIAERDRQSPTLLALERVSGRPVALVILDEVPVGEAALDLRIGYVIAEDAWGTGLATELVAGLIEWARTQPAIHTVTGGVDAANLASARVLAKNGFERVTEGGQRHVTYRLHIEHEVHDEPTT